MKKNLLLVVSAIFLFAFQADAQGYSNGTVIIDNTLNGTAYLENSLGSITALTNTAKVFKTPAKAGKLNKIKLSLFNNRVSNAGTVTAALHLVDALGNPTGAALASQSFTLSLNTTPAYYDLNLDDNNWRLAASTEYALVISGYSSTGTVSWTSTYKNYTASEGFTFIRGRRTFDGGTSWNGSSYQYGLQLSWIADPSAALSSNADLSNLTLSGASLNETFAPATTAYTATVPGSVSSITVTPAKADANATVKVNGADVASGSASQAIPLNEGSNQVTVTVKAQNGTSKVYTIGVTRAASSLPQHTLSFNGTNQYVAVPNKPAFDFTTGTVEMWVKPDWTANTRGASLCIISMRSAAGTRYSIHMDDNLRGIGIWNNSNYFTRPYTFTKGQWYHVAVKMTTSATEFFVNGVSIGATANGLNSARTGYELKIGASETGPNKEYFLGEIDEVRIWNTARTATNILQNYNKPVSPSSAGLIAYYPIEADVAGPANAVAKKVTDITAHANHGTLYNYYASNANLSNLTFSTGTLSPAFAAATTSYASSVPNDVSSVNVTPTVADGKATVKVNNQPVASGHSVNVPLTTGVNPVAILVTAEDGSAKTYTVTVTRTGSSNTNISTVSINPGQETLNFDQARGAYTASVANSVSETAVALALEDANATLTINGVVATNGQPFAVPLAFGENEITAVVKAQDGVTQKTTKFIVTRAKPAPVFTSAPITEATEYVPYTYTLSATGSDANALTFSGINLPGWLSLGLGGSAGVPLGGEVSQPGAIVTDSDGNVYATGISGSIVYKIAPDGTTTAWLTRQSGNVFDMAVYEGHLYISYWSHNKITRVNLSNPQAGEADFLTGLNAPSAITVRDNFFYVSLYSGNRVIKVDPKTKQYTNYVTGIPLAFGSDFDKNGNFYVASFSSGTIYKYDGTALTEAIKSLGMAFDVEVDKNGSLYVGFSGGLRKYTSDLSAYTPIVSNNLVRSIAVDPTGGMLYGDFSLNRVVKLQSGVTLAGTPKHTDVGTHQVTVRVSEDGLHADQTFTITVKDVTAPSVAIASGQASPAKDAFTVSFTFSEEVAGFTLENITAVNATVSGLQTTDNITFTAKVTPAADGEVSLEVKAGAVADKNGNPNTASNLFKIIYDITKPTVEVYSKASEHVNAPFTVVFTFSEVVSGFTQADITVTNGSASLFESANGQVYTALITPAADGEVTVSAAADVATDAAANGNEASNTLTRTYDATKPTVTLATTAASPTNAPFVVTFRFSEEVNGFEVADITITNGAASDFTKVEGKTYTALVTPAADGEVTVAVAANKAQDIATNGNEASDVLKLTFDATSPTGYTLAFNANRVDVNNVANIALSITGAEVGTTYFYTIASSNGGAEVMGKAQVQQSGFDLNALDLTTLNDGTLTATLYLLDAAGNKGANATAEVVKITRDIVAVTVPEVIKVPIRTAYANVPLPAKVEVTYATGAKEQLSVTWSQGNYNGLVAGAYELTGELILAPMTTNLTQQIAKVTVEVQPNKAPTALAFSATTFKPEATADDVIGTLSTTDPDDTEFSYTLATGQGDTHNHLFGVRDNQLYLKSNKGLSGMTSFTIRVRSTDPYLNTIERTFTLTKQAYDRTVDQLKIVNAFSPNGDGINDNWTIPELRFYNNVHIQVFDRSGVRVFETNDPEKGWDGRGLNGQILKGAFLFTVEVQDINWVKRGTVTILGK